jgi:hypothetical protein
MGPPDCQPLAYYDHFSFPRQLNLFLPTTEKLFFFFEKNYRET